MYLFHQDRRLHTYDSSLKSATPKCLVNFISASAIASSWAPVSSSSIWIKDFCWQSFAGVTEDGVQWSVYEVCFETVECLLGKGIMLVAAAACQDMTPNTSQ